MNFRNRLQLGFADYFRTVPIAADRCLQERTFDRQMSLQWGLAGKITL